MSEDINYMHWDNQKEFKTPYYYINGQKFDPEKWNIVSDTIPKVELKRFEYEIDYKFWSILPYINVNFHFPEIEIGWLCFIFAWRYKI